ncbi:MAG: hypothetical protein IJS93_03505 [Clostridia bacterium]|nr:hypothetical protein [Clostridia bacterium]
MKKNVLRTLVVVLLIAIFVFSCACAKTDNTTVNNKGNDNGNTGNDTPACVHDFDDGVCSKCGAWDGVSTPVPEILDQYCDKYLSYIRAESYPSFAETYDYNFETDPELEDQGMYWTWYDEEINVVREVSARDHEEVDKMIADGRIDKNKNTIIFVHGICVTQYPKTLLKVVDGQVVEATYEEYIAEHEYEIIEIPSDGYGTLTNTVTVDPTLPLYSEYVDYTGNVNLNLIYLKNGFNVLNFSYIRFGDESTRTISELCDDGVTREFTLANNATIEEKVYSVDGAAGMRYRKQDGVFSDGNDGWGNVVEGAEVHDDPDFSIAEYFAAEYVRMFDYMAKKNVFNENTHMRISGHSMGGVVTTIGTFLLTELARVGQIPVWYVPDRIALEDSYFGAYTDYGENVPTYKSIADTVRAEYEEENAIREANGEALFTEKDILSAIKVQQDGLKGVKMLSAYGCTIHWTGKKIAGGGTPCLYLAALRQVVRDYGVVAEYYVDESGMGNGGMAYASITAPIINELIRTYTSTIAYVFKFPKSFNSHNGVREAHCVSFLFPVYKDVDGNITASASATDEEIKAATGKQWYQYKGNETSDQSDDVFKTYTGKATPPVYAEEK